MEWQWGNDPEYTIYLYKQSGFWALPFSVNWVYHKNTSGKSSILNIKVKPYFNLSFSIYFLCFGFSFEMWRYNI